MRPLPDDRRLARGDRRRIGVANGTAVLAQIEGHARVAAGGFVRAHLEDDAGNLATASATTERQAARAAKKSGAAKKTGAAKRTAKKR